MAASASVLTSTVTVTSATIEAHERIHPLDPLAHATRADTYFNPPGYFAPHEAVEIAVGPCLNESTFGGSSEEMSRNVFPLKVSINTGNHHPQSERSETVCAYIGTLSMALPTTNMLWCTTSSVTILAWEQDWGARTETEATQRVNDTAGCRSLTTRQETDCTLRTTVRKPSRPPMDRLSLSPPRSLSHFGDAAAVSTSASKKRQKKKGYCPSYFADSGTRRNYTLLPQPSAAHSPLRKGDRLCKSKRKQLHSCILLLGKKFNSGWDKLSYSQWGGIGRGTMTRGQWLCCRCWR